MIALYRHPLLSLVLLVCAAVLAAGQPQSLLKWSQPPDPATPQNLFFGWNEHSNWWLGPIVADDWICTTPDPVTDVHWWGSFLGWNLSTPPQLPSHFHIQFWTDVPTSPGGFSHPGVLIHEVLAYNYTWQWVGWDFDPRLSEYEACFRFDYQFTPAEYFYQDPTGTPTVYWISIAACDGGGDPGPHPFGWKTLPHIDSGGPDCAVRIWQPIQPVPGSEYELGEPIWWPDEFNQWDMAFELTTLTGGGKIWDQPPELSPIGTDVNASRPPGATVPYILADDFLCTTTGPISEIVIFGSWYHDMVPPPPEILFTISIHTDVPAPPGGYSMPGEPLWWRTFGPGEYIMEPFAVGIPEGWLNPPDWYEPMADTICWMVRFPLQPGEFIQTGTPDNPVIYWLDLHVDVLAGPTDVMFGWKTSLAHWNDLAVWGIGWEPYPGPWEPLLPPQLPPVDLAFQVIGQGGQPGVKWSQPPVPFMPGDAYNGWDQLSEYGLQLAADDWVCTTDNPVTDLHWWGSFLGWAHPFPPPLPHAFHIGIWTDVPADPAQPGSFSHPGVLLWQNYCDTYAVEFAGWDFDPRQIDGLSQPPEATFRFTLLLEPDAWFWQEPGENVYWLSIAALPCDCNGDLNGDGVINLMDLALLASCYGQFPGGACARADLTCDGIIDAQDSAALQCLITGHPPSQCCPGYTPDAPLFGWKTRPRYDSPAPDDAVAIFAPNAPMPGEAYELGTPLYYPTPAESWDLAFELTSVPRDNVICEPQGSAANPFHPPTYWYDVTVDDPGLGRCDFHVRVFDPNPANYTNPSLPPTWQFAVHQLSNGEWWASWWDPDCSHALFNTTFRFQFNNPNPNTWAKWTTTIAGTNDPYQQLVDQATNHAHQPDGYGYHVHVPQVMESYVKWAQPPTRKNQFPDYFYGWNEPSLYFGPQLVADDFQCCDPRPISDVHWWGSYLDWLEPVPPPVQPSSWHIGLWTDVPAGPGQAWSHPGILIYAWEVPATAVAVAPVGVDFHPEYGYETCFRYDVQFPNAEWFYQPDVQEIFWISIGAIYDFLPPEHVWGWKTRQPKWHDDAVRIFAPLPPAIGAPFEAGTPIENGEGSWDMAFSLTSPVPPPPICIGDIDGSGFVDFGDINPFVLRLSNPVAYREVYPCVPDAHADIDQSGAVDFGDINPFVALLSNNPLPIPCP